MHERVARDAAGHDAALRIAVDEQLAFGAHVHGAGPGVADHAHREPMRDAVVELGREAA